MQKEKESKTGHSFSCRHDHSPASFSSHRWDSKSEICSKTALCSLVWTPASPSLFYVKMWKMFESWSIWTILRKRKIMFIASVVQLVQGPRARPTASLRGRTANKRKNWSNCWKIPIKMWMRNCTRCQEWNTLVVAAAIEEVKDLQTRDRIDHVSFYFF